MHYNIFLIIQRIKNRRQIREDKSTGSHPPPLSFFLLYPYNAYNGYNGYNGYDCITVAAAHIRRPFTAAAELDPLWVSTHKAPRRGTHAARTRNARTHAL